MLHVHCSLTAVMSEAGSTLTHASAIAVLGKGHAVNLLILLKLLSENDIVPFGEVWPHLSFTDCMALTQNGARMLQTR